MAKMFEALPSRKKSNLTIDQMIKKDKEIEMGEKAMSNVRGAGSRPRFDNEGRMVDKTNPLTEEEKFELDQVVKEKLKKNGINSGVRGDGSEVPFYHKN